MICIIPKIFPCFLISSWTFQDPGHTFNSYSSIKTGKINIGKDFKFGFFFCHYQLKILYFLELFKMITFFNDYEIKKCSLAFMPPNSIWIYNYHWPACIPLPFDLIRFLTMWHNLFSSQFFLILRCFCRGNFFQRKLKLIVVIISSENSLKQVVLSECRF